MKDNYICKTDLLCLPQQPKVRVSSVLSSSSQKDRVKHERIRMKALDFDEHFRIIF